MRINIIIWIFLGVFLMSLSACGEEESAPSSSETATVEQTTVSEAAPEPTPAVATEEQSVDIPEPEPSPAAATDGESTAPQTHTINAEARVFNPDIIYIQSGDSVGWTNMTSHNTVSVDGLIPEGAQHWRGALGENLKITLNIEGIYAYVCEPHIGFGMVGVIVVGKPDNLEEVKKKAGEILQGPYRRILGKLNKVQIPQ